MNQSGRLPGQHRLGLGFPLSLAISLFNLDNLLYREESEVVKELVDIRIGDI